MYEQAGENSNAIEAYLNASIKDPGQSDVYEKIYQLMLPQKRTRISGRRIKRSLMSSREELQ